MTRFGAHWRDHPGKIRENTQHTVGESDILLLPGDLSWASRRHAALPDLAFLAALPGRKICIKGNHDHWWDSGKPIGYPGLEEPPVHIGPVGFAGTRGWQTPRGDTASADTRMIDRERHRLVRSLEAIESAPIKVVLLHYPPHPFEDVLQDYGVDVVVYGHLHVDSLPEDEALVMHGETMGGARCWCVAADRIDFRPFEVPLPRCDGRRPEGLI